MYLINTFYLIIFGLFKIHYIQYQGTAFMLKFQNFKETIQNTHVFISNSSILFNKQPFFDFKNEFVVSVKQNGKLLKRKDIIAI